MNTLLTLAFVAAVTAASPSFAASASSVDAAAPVACADLAMTPLQHRLVAKADEGVATLRRFVFITRGIYGLDTTEVADWIAGQRAARRDCRAAG